MLRYEFCNAIRDLDGDGRSEVRDQKTEFSLQLMEKSFL